MSFSGFFQAVVGSLNAMFGGTSLWAFGPGTRAERALIEAEVLMEGPQLHASSMDNLALYVDEKYRREKGAMAPFDPWQPPYGSGQANSWGEVL